MYCRTKHVPVFFVLRGRFEGLIEVSSGVNRYIRARNVLLFARIILLSQKSHLLWQNYINNNNFTILEQFTIKIYLFWPDCNKSKGFSMFQNPKNRFKIVLCDVKYRFSFRKIRKTSKT